MIGLLNVTRALLPVLHRQGNGHVINISSIGGYQAYDGIHRPGQVAHRRLPEGARILPARVVSALSPLQYQKQRRRLPSRTRLFASGCSVTAAAHEVGYHSEPQLELGVRSSTRSEAAKSRRVRRIARPISARDQSGTGTSRSIQPIGPSSTRYKISRL